MKKFLFILTIIAFTNFTYAQTTKAVSTNNTESISDYELFNKAIANDTDLMSQALNILNANSETKAIISQYTKGNQTDFDSAMKNSKISDTVIEWINNDPKVYKQVMTTLSKLGL